MKPHAIRSTTFRPFEWLTRYIVSEAGQDSVEYALIAALITPLVIAIILLVGPQLNLYFQDVVNAIP